MPAPKSKGRVLLVDADMLVYTAATGAQHNIDWDGDGNAQPVVDFEKAKTSLDESVKRLKKTLSADRVVMALSDYEDPWRVKVLPSYKENRKGKERPVLIDPLREYVHANYTTYQRPGLEGDDILGILLTSKQPISGNKVVVSDDKDMKTLPGTHYNMKHKRLFTVTQEDADWWHMMQTMMGDTTDGYKGAKGVGPVKAEATLGEHRTYEEMWPRVLAAFEKAGQTPEEALVQARVSRICRAVDYDFINKRVILWNPPETKEAQP